MSAPKKVLLVEDEFILYDELVEFFENHGFKVAGKNGSNKPVATYHEAIDVLHSEEPDFAVLDIKIKGDKDGLELGSYIRQHYNIPIIFLTAYNNDQNMERAIGLAADGFVIKHDKPVNKTQLLADVKRLKNKIEQAYKQRTLGRFMKVKEVDLLQFERKIKAGHQQPADPVELKTYVKWDEIKMITSSNKIARNTILLYTIQQNKGYFYRSTLDEIESLLPDYFSRFNSGTIVNIHTITAEGKTADVYYLDDVRVEISGTCKEAAFTKLKLYLGDKI